MSKGYIKTKFIIVGLGIIVLSLLCVRIGSIDLSYKEILLGLFTNTNEEVEIIKVVRLPRIFIALFTGAMLATSGVLLQSVMKNPLADPGIIGISSGAQFASSVATTFQPTLFFLTPLFGFIGGIVACILVYAFAWKRGFKAGRIILAGIAVNAFFGALSEVISYIGGSSLMVSAAGGAQGTTKDWHTVLLIAIYGMIGLIWAGALYKKCDMLRLGELDARSLGLNINHTRIHLSLVAVLLAIIPTTQVGMISFVGLVVPHLARIIVGSEHKILIPFTALLGGALLILADFLGRSLMSPFEIPLNVMMALLGAPFFLYMLKTTEG